MALAVGEGARWTERKDLERTQEKRGVICKPNS